VDAPRSRTSVKAVTPEWFWLRLFGSAPAAIKAEITSTDAVRTLFFILFLFIFYFY
jgi:hypothetical protein